VPVITRPGISHRTPRPPTGGRALGRRLALGGVCLAVAGCAARNAIWVEPGSGDGRVTFRVSATPGGTAPIEHLYGLTVSTCDGRVVWTMRSADVASAARPTRIEYGEPPAGYVSAAGPEPLAPGCYRATVSGPASVVFTVGGDGRVEPRRPPAPPTSRPAPPPPA
jgi:hypothetical protein